MFDANAGVAMKRNAKDRIVVIKVFFI